MALNGDKKLSLSLKKKVIYLNNKNIETMELKDINPAVADHLTILRKKNLSLYPPATDLALKIDALFQHDPNVFTAYEPETCTIKIFVKRSARRADAINWLVGHKKREFKFNVEVIYIAENGITEQMATPSYDITGEGIIDFVKITLNGIGFGWQMNDVFVPLTQTTYHFLEIEAMPLAIANDNFGNPYGFSVILARDLFEEAFETGGLMVSTYVRKATGEIPSGKGSFGYAFSW